MCLCVFRAAHEFEMVTLSDQLICAADNQEALLSHLVHILKVNLCVCVCVCVSISVRTRVLDIEEEVRTCLVFTFRCLKVQT